MFELFALEMFPFLAGGSRGLQVFMEGRYSCLIVRGWREWNRWSFCADVAWIANALSMATKREKVQLHTRLP